MKNLLAAAFLLSFALPLPAEEELEADKDEAVKAPLDFADHLQDPAKWQLGQGGSLRLKMDGDATLFLRNGREEIFRLTPPEYVSQAVLSDDKKSLFIVVMKRVGFSSDHVCLLRIKPAGDKLQVDRTLESGQKLFDGNRWWIVDLGAAANDGKSIVARFSIGLPDSYLSTSRWHTVDVESLKILGEGLTLENGKQPAKK